MRRHSTTARFTRAVFGGLLGVLLVAAASATAIAADDEEDEDTFEQRIIKGILGGMGVNTGQPGIDYRERSPLVVPPTRDLPPPDSAAPLLSNPAWPKDADVQQRKPKKDAKLVNGSVRQMEMERATGAPGAVGPKGAPGSGRVSQPSPNDNLDPGRPSMPSELGVPSGGLFSWFGGSSGSSLWGSSKPETAPFDGEPPRTSLTQPPTGYQTPSASYPYGINSEKKNNSTLNLPLVKDRAAADPTQ